MRDHTSHTNLHNPGCTNAYRPFIKPAGAGANSLQGFFRHPPFVMYSFNCSLSTHFEWTRWPHFILSTRWYPVDFFFKEHNSLLWIISSVWYHMVWYFSWFRMIVLKNKFFWIRFINNPRCVLFAYPPIYLYLFFLNTVFCPGPRSIFPRSTAVSCCYAGLRDAAASCQCQAFSPWACAKKKPRFSVNKYSHFVGNIPLVLLFGLKHLCASVHRGFCRRQAEQKGCFFTTDPGALPLSAAPGSHWAGFVKGIPVNTPPIPSLCFSLLRLSAASQHSTVHTLVL